MLIDNILFYSMSEDDHINQSFEDCVANSQESTTI